MTAIVRVDNLSFAYRPGRAVLEDLTFCVERGGFTAIVGPNGAGKSTLLNLLSAAARPACGTITIDGHGIDSYNAAALARKMAVVRQESNCAFGFSVAETVMMARTSYLGPWGFEGRADREVVMEALAATDTAQFAERPLDGLSGGERQRVLIARALAQETAILLLDEPTSFLDLKHQVAICDLLKAAQIDGGRTIVVVMHDINLAGQYCDHVLLLGSGAEYEYGPPDRVLSPDTIERFFGVSTYCADIGGGRYFLPMGKFARDRQATDDSLPGDSV
jgi:iron complex transport system ATP-binding protein